MILTENNIKEHQIEKILGKPINVNWRELKAIGTSSLFLKTYISKNDSEKIIEINSKCSFQSFTNGILLRSNKSNKQTVLLIKTSDIIKIKLRQGKELINPKPYFPMWILLKLGVSIRYARYFNFWPGEYSIDEMNLEIETINETIKFIQNGYVFEGQLIFFKNLNLGNKLIVYYEQ